MIRLDADPSLLRRPVVRGVALHRKIGTARPRAPIPRQIHPTGIQSDYARRLEAYAGVAKRALRPLLDALPQLLPATAEPRKADAAGDGRAAALIQRAKDAMSRALVNRDIEALAQQFAKTTSTYQRTQLQKQLRAGLGADVFIADSKLGGLMSGFVADNVALIKDIPAQMIADVSAIMRDAIDRARPHPDVAQEIQERLGIGDRRARLIARDQVGKLYGQINAQRQKDLGITRFTWRSVGDVRVRREHASLDGRVFEYKAPPPEGLPGQPVLCRCSAEPVLDDILTEAAADVPETVAPLPEELQPIPQLQPQADPAEVDYVDDPPPVVEFDDYRRSSYAEQAQRYAERISAQERTALQSYAGNGFGRVNAYARGQPVSGLVTAAEVKARVQELDAAIAKSTVPKDVSVYRGLAGGVWADAVVGAELQDLAHVSTSIDRSVAINFAHMYGDKETKTVMQINLRAGMHAAPLEELSGNDEFELLLPRGSRFVVTGVEEGVFDRGYRYNVVHVDALPPEPGPLPDHLRGSGG